MCVGNVLADNSSEAAFKETFKETFFGEDGSSFEAPQLSKEVEKRSAVLLELEMLPRYEINDREEDATCLGDKALLFIYDLNPDLQQDLFQLESMSAEEELYKS